MTSLTVHDLSSAPQGDVGARFSYTHKARQKLGHLICCNVFSGEQDEDVLPALRSMATNTVLEGLVKGQDYQWVGLSAIGFRRKEDSALFLLFCDAARRK